MLAGDLLITDVATLLLIFAAFLCIYNIFRSVYEASIPRLPLPPSLPSIPLVGSLPWMNRGLKDLPGFLRTTSQRLGPVFGFSIGTEYVVVLNTREMIHEALVKQASSFSGRSPGYTATQILNPHRYGIGHKQYGPEFRKLHQVTLKILKEFGFGLQIMQERILREIDELMELIQENDSLAFNPSDRLTVCTLNVIASILFSDRFSQRDLNLSRLAFNLRDYVQGERRMVDIFPVLRHLPKYKAAIQAASEYQREHLEYIDRQLSLSLESERASFVKSFVEEMGASEWERNELKFIVRDLLVAGTETTSTTVQITMIHMANHPALQRRIQAELESVVDVTSHVTLDATGMIPYIEATILEIYRLYTVVPLSVPHCTLKNSQLAGFFIPKSTTVLPNIHSAHMDANLWEEPEEFLPERFLDEDGKVKGRELVIPFSLGKRSCLGEQLARQEIYLIVSNLLLKFNILPPEGQERVVVSENYLSTLFLSPYKLRFIPRV